MATGSDESVATVYEEGRCSICLETFKEPTTLLCKHVFCKPCISQYLESTDNTKQKLNPKIYTCPICRTDLTDQKNDLSNLVVNQIVVKSSLSNMRKRDCDVCRQKDKMTIATQWCRECHEAFCDDCSSYHDLFQFSKNHQVSSLEEFDVVKGFDVLGEYSDKCPSHPEQLAEAYCLDHGLLCCILCVTTTHRKCENVRAIKSFVDKEGVLHETGSKTYVLSFETDLSIIQTATTELLRERKEDKTKVEQSFLDIEESVNTTVLKIKDNLDALMISFQKELHLKQDDFESKNDPIIKEIEMFKETVDKAVEKADFVRNYGTKTQLFIHLEKTKDEIKKALEKTMRPLLGVKKLESQLVLQNVAQQMEKLSSLGQVEILEKDDLEMATFKTLINETACNFNVGFNNIEAQKDKTIEIGENVRCGTCAGYTTLLVASGQKIFVYDILTGKILNQYDTKAGGNSLKRLSYQEDSTCNCLYISYFSGFLQRVRFNKQLNEFSDLVTIKSNSPYNGGVCNDGNSFYTIVDKGICKDFNMQTHIFKTNTKCDCGISNDIAFDKLNKRFVYTSTNFEVVAISMNGKEIFKYKDDSMKTVSSVAVGPNGIIFAGDESGCVHVISEDGKQRKTLINKCQKIPSVLDIWVDDGLKILYVCGDKYIEAYNIG